MKYIVAVLSLVFFIGCGGGGGSDSQTPSGSCTMEEQNKFLYDYMKSWYLWNDEMPSIYDFSAYDSPNDLLNVLKVSQDRWSYVMDSKELESELSGDNNNFGVRYSITNSGLLVAYTLPYSPMREAGIGRGDIITELNGNFVPNLSRTQIQTLFDNQALTFTYRKPSENTTSSAYVQKANYTSSPVLYSSVISSDGLNIGYVVLESFDYQTNEKMAEVFAWFKQKNVNRIIFDLRYNGGGLLDEIRYLGYMLRSSAGDKEAITIRYNNNHQASNQTLDFESNPAFNPFNFNEIIFLTSEDTASASEALINALVPYTNVYLIGSNTHGKPVGMNIQTYCGNSYLPIVFRVENANGNSTSFDGIRADCQVEDTGYYSFGDTKESLLSAGINYIKTGVCNSNISTKSSKIRYFTDINRHKGAIIMSKDNLY